VTSVTESFRIRVEQTIMTCWADISLHCLMLPMVILIPVHQGSYKSMAAVGVQTRIMSTSPDSPFPTALVAPIIEGYVQGIRPAFSFILISAIFSAMLIPLLAMMFALSTSQSRRTPIFILNVLAVSLGLVVGALCGHLTIQSILSPFTGINGTEDFVYNILYIWMPWITEAVLVVRVVVVYAPAYQSSRIALLLAFTIAVKVARAAINIVFLVQWKRSTSSGSVNQFSTTESLNGWMIKAAWILELLDNGYISFLFLWRLNRQAHIFNGEKVGRVDSRDSFTNKLKSLFWIASTNFVFPVVFGLCQIILLFTGRSILVAASVEMVNVYISIISTVFATIWSSTTSFKDARALSYNNVSNLKPHHQSIRFLTFREVEMTKETDVLESQSSSTHEPVVEGL